jgi:hypothetical protein
MSTHSFPKFSLLPQELRRFIWNYALPGPRIVYIKRYLSPLTVDESESDSFEELYGLIEFLELPKQYHFSSPSPSQPITALLGACAESRAFAREHYSTLYPYVSYEDGNGAASGDSFKVVDARVKPTWFDFERDWLYLDWGHTNTNSPPALRYTPQDFLPKPHKCPMTGCQRCRNVIPEARMSEVRRLIVFNYGSFQYRHNFRAHNAESLLSDVLKAFPSVSECVIADQMHGRDAHAEELEWLFGNVESGLENEETDGIKEAQLLLDEAETNWEVVKRSIMAPDVQWKNQELGFDLHKFVAGWNDISNRKRVRSGPTVARKIITTSATKRALLTIFGSEQNLKQHLGDFTWQMNACEISLHQPSLLGLSQQIALLELVLRRIQFEYEDELLRADFEGESLLKVEYLLDKLDRLKDGRNLASPSWDDVLLREAEDMGSQCY